ncbi:MAG: hypothetical protein KAQ92_04420 [Candidatus Aenigmarchaeota archaeon]|nr:hypothetical protein [Candidatus Aenigmarchaeota archaeon]
MLDYDKFLTAEDKVVYRFFLLATMFLSPIGLLYVSYYNIFSTINMWSFIFIIPLLSTPFIMISHILYFAFIENLTSTLDSIKKHCNEINKKIECSKNILDLMNKDIEKKVPFLIIKDNLFDLNLW